MRRLLAENGIDESEVTPTGAGGRITREDVLRVVDARRTTAPPAAAAPAATTAAGATTTGGTTRASAQRRPHRS